MFSEFEQAFVLGTPNSVSKMNGVQLVFAPTRSRVISAGIDGLPFGLHEKVTWTSCFGEPHVVQATWDRPLDIASDAPDLRIRVALEEVPLVAASLTWRRQLWWPRSRLPAKLQAWGHPWAEEVERIWKREARAPLIALAKEWQSRASRLEGTTLSTDKYRLFFANIDGRTLRERKGVRPPPSPVMRCIADKMRKFLSERLSARLQGNTVPTAAGGYPIAAWLTLLSRVLIWVYQAPTFGWPALTDPATRPAAVDDVATAFCDFASGSLAIKEDNVNGQPDSGYFFLFAEFALTVLDGAMQAQSDYKIEPDDQEIWRALLPALVASQRSFMVAYSPPNANGHPRPWPEWRYENRAWNLKNNNNVGGSPQAGLNRYNLYKTTRPDYAEQSRQNALAAFGTGPLGTTVERLHCATYVS